MLKQACSPTQEAETRGTVKLHLNEKIYIIENKLNNNPCSADTGSCNLDVEKQVTVEVMNTLWLSRRP